ncbi:Hypothetical predicted protein, partial [Paramuricea clavata]
MASNKSQSTSEETAMELDGMSRSIRSYRSHLSRTITTTKRFVTVTKEHGSSSAKDALLSRLEEVQGYFRKIVDLTMAMQQSDNRNLDKYDDDLDVDRARFDELSERVMEAIADNPTPQPRINAENEERRPVRINDSLKPSMLSKDASPTELKQWLEQYEAYYESNQMSKMTIKEQHSYFKMLLDSDLRTRMAAQTGPRTNIFGNESLIESLKEDFAMRYPLVTRRLDYFSRKQKNGEQFSDFLSKLKELGELADLDGITKEDILVFSSLSGTNNKELLDDLLKIEDASLKNIEKAAKV